MSRRIEEQGEVTGVTTFQNRTADNPTIAKALKTAREKLLDLTLRNRLLSFKHSNRSIEIKDGTAEQVYKLLVLDQGSMQCLADVTKDENEQPVVKETPDDIPVLTEAPVEIAIDQETFLPPSGKSEEAVKDRHSDRFLQTTLPAKQLQTRLLHIYYDAQTIVQETGTNMLYLALGFLEWNEEKGAKSSMALAPLILVPVKIERSGIKSIFSISWTGEDLETNISLAVKMRELGVELPALPETEDIQPERYFQAVSAATEDKKAWKVRRDMALGFFHFGKLRMYLDLDPALWGGTEHFEKHPTLGTVFGGTAQQDHSPFIIEDHDVAFDADSAPIVMDADSSQHAVILEALTGKNLVIEGPPGTGKSQTITNLIAGFLNQGKTVLFVSEKAAALEVVRDRLKEVGLGDFCMELHSHKANKQFVLQALKQRIDKGRALACDLTITHEELRKLKKTLREYAIAVNAPIKDSHVTPIQAVGRIEEVLSRFSELRHLALPKINDAEQTAPGDYKDRVQLLSDLADCLKSLGRPADHPLSGLKAANLMPGDEKAICTAFDDLTIQIGNLNDFWRNAPLPWNQKLSLGSIAAFRQHVADLDPLPNEFPADLIEKLLASDTVTSLESAQQKSQQIKMDMAAVHKVIDMRALPESLTALLSNLRYLQLNVPGLDWQNKDTMADDLSELAAKFASLSDTLPRQWLQDLANAANCDATTISAIIACAQLAAKLPEYANAALFPAFTNQAAAECLDQALAKKLVVDALAGELAPVIRLEEVREDLSSLADTLESLSSEFLVSMKLGVFNARYRQATAKLKLLWQSKPPKGGPVEWARLLRKHGRYAKALAELNEFQPMHDLLGSHYKGISSRWDQFQAAKDWCATIAVQQALPDAFKKMLLSDKAKELVVLCSSLHDTVSNNQTRCNALLQEISGIMGKPDDLLGEGNFAEKKDRAAQLQTAISSASEQLKTILVAPVAGTIGDWIKNIEFADNLRKRYRLFVSDSSLKTLLGDHFLGVKTKWDSLLAAAQWCTKAKAAFAPSIIDWLMTDQIRQRWQLTVNFAKQSDDQVAAVEKATQFLQSVCEFQPEELWRGQFNELATTALMARCREIAYASVRFAEWIQFSRLLQAATEASLEPFAAPVMEDPMFADSLPGRYVVAFNEGLLRYAHNTRMPLRTFRRASHDSIRGKFQALDKKMLALTRETVAAHAASRSIPNGYYGAKVSDLTELKLLEHEIGKEKRHRPLRELILRAGKAMQALKPVFMMSPMSVAQYLKPLHITFDVLIMDEASQIRPENAFGAMARANQVVIVGDTKQLPPTDFFQADLSEEETDDTSTFEQLESILEFSTKVFPSRRLQWHYRSRHQSLIAFSNAEWYEHQLVFLPSAVADNELFGIKWHPTSGVYDRGKTRKNRIEAAAVAKCVLEHARKYPHLSLGVGTLNQPQAEAIEEELEVLRATHPDCEEFFSNKRFSAGNEEPFFIKNLENIQGDERDVMIISIGFAKDKDGILHQTFGPLTRDGGWRRLNVLVTRARQRVHVFSSITAEDIEPNGRTTSGSAALKRYLAYAQSRVLEQPQESGRQPESPFEEAVIAMLRREGYKVTPQLGVRGFFIDIAVHDPSKPGKYVLAVECDGATYHSLKSTRDRDRLRESALVDQGWKVHRIWSTSWFTEPEAERKRLLEALRAACG